jgi:ribosomal protein L7/L12
VTNSPRIQKLLQLIGELNVIEIGQLETCLGTTFTLEKLQEAVQPAPEYWRLRIDSNQPKKIQAIKFVRQYNGMGLLEAKNLVESAAGPFHPILNSGISQSDAAKIVNEADALGVNIYAERVP